VGLVGGGGSLVPGGAGAASWVAGLSVGYVYKCGLWCWYGVSGGGGFCCAS
jgi:hypothetical protein